jgi:hypothetical protein|tara:strand:+ start:422 stop:817 length:396 start_codon:yes stop_codon:yes gene_type:complete
MIAALIPLISSVIDKVIPDKNGAEKAKQAIEAELIKNATQLNLAQAETNKIEAEHRTVFVAGWRPFIGWVCGAAMAWHFVAAPLIIFVCAWYGLTIPTLPVFDMQSLMTVLMGLLGLGSMRTFEKMKGLTK